MTLRSSCKIKLWNQTSWTKSSTDSKKMTPNSFFWLTGAPGIGKTAIAQRVDERLRQNFEVIPPKSSKQEPRTVDQWCRSLNGRSQFQLLENSKRPVVFIIEVVSATINTIPDDLEKFSLECKKSNENYKELVFMIIPDLHSHFLPDSSSS
ncbi:hypothetical protein C8J56DRAFT_175640 [Mycena floridula]|nr:hypothetical protein C8J56DRAFT_175640 [Mycena floridula]